MKQQWWAYVIVGVLSIGAGVAIAGLPNNVAVDDTIMSPGTTEAPAATSPERSEPPATTESPATTAASGPSTTTAPSTTDPAPSTSEAPAPVMPERSELRVVAANGADIAGAAVRVAERLEEIGYVDVSALNGTQINDGTVVHHADGLELAAARLAEELGLAPTAVAPLAVAPLVIALPAETQLLVYIGLDLA